jgi:hypothetical protein
MSHTPATPADVKAITGSTLADGSITPFLTAAACIIASIEDDCAAHVTDACLTQAEAFLASHLLTSSNVGSDSKQVMKESLRGKYSVEYLSSKAQGSGVLSTTFGETANMLTGGCLAELDKSPINMLSIGSIGSC